MAFLAVISTALLAQGQNAVQKYVEQLKTTDELKEAVWGIRAVKVGGGGIAEYNSRTRMMPASNVKVFTTGLALNELGADYRFRTRLAYSGSIEDGVLKGDLYIVGGGDPTIGARDSVAFALQKTFSEWEKLVRAAGIKSIEGYVVGDGRWLDCEPQNVSWQLEDAATGDGTVMTGLGFGSGLQAFTVAPGTKAGDPVKVTPSFPDTPWMNWTHTAVTGPSGSGDQLYYACTDLAPVASMTGSLALGTAAKRITCTNPFGALTCAFYFYRYLENKGITASEGPADIDPSGRLRDFAGDGAELRAAVAQDALTFIGESKSPTLKDIIKQANGESDNYYAEALLRILAKERTGSASFESCQTARQDAFAKLGVSGADRVQFYDGSGLARKNYITPDFTVRFLTAMTKVPGYKDYLSSLPQAGSGTLASRLRSAPESVRKRVRMKSGSMNGVRCFSGYILASDGKPENTIVFSIMTNNTVVPSSKMNFIMDRIITLLAEEN